MKRGIAQVLVFFVLLILIALVVLSLNWMGSKFLREDAYFCTEVLMGLLCTTLAAGVAYIVVTLLGVIFIFAGDLVDEYLWRFK